MSDNLPDIEFKEKKEKKGGALGWLRNKLGFGSRGAVGGTGVGNPAAMNAGRASLNMGKAFGAGAGKFGASSGIAGLLAGKAGMIATVAMVAVASGVYLANNSPSSSTGTAAFSSEMSGDKYVPAILRSQAANQGSSLEMFKDSNKGALAMEAEPGAAADPKDGAAADAAAEAEGQAEEPAAPGENMAQDMMAKLQGGNMSTLTSQLGGGSNKFSNMGGFGNKHNTGATGMKTGFTSGIGAGFTQMPKFDQRKNKMLSMKGTARPVFGGAKAGKKGSIGAGAFNQAKGMRDIQKSYKGDTADGARSTQDKAWEGTTGDDAAAGGGAGLSDGGAGIVTSPSLDNVGDTSAGGGGGTPAEPVVPDASLPTDISPWSSLTSMAMMLILMAALLAGIGSKLVNMGTTMIAEGTASLPYGAPLVAAGTAIRGIGMLLAGIAIALGLAATIMGIMIMKQQGQQQMGTLYTIGGGVAMAAGGMAMAGANIGPITPMWMAAGAAVIALIGSMLGGK